MDGKERFGATRLAETEEEGTYAPTTNTKHESGSVPKLVGRRPSQAGQRHEKLGVETEKVLAKAWPAKQRTDSSPQPPLFPKSTEKCLV